jgi:hypothetical protein
VADRIRHRGVRHAYGIEKLRAFRAVPVADKLRWLEEVRTFVGRLQTPEARRAMMRFRRGEL